MSVQTTTAIADIAKCSEVILAGNLQRIPDYDEFSLQDATGRIELCLATTGIGLTVCAAVSVICFVESALLSKGICASSLIRAERTVVEIPNCDN